MSATIVRRLPSMGGEAFIRLDSDDLGEDGLATLADGIEDVLTAVEDTLTPFREDSELSALNRDPRAAVPVSPLVRELVRAAHRAASLSHGLVDATTPGERRARTLDPSPPPSLADALRAAPPRRPARARLGWARSRPVVDEDGRVWRTPSVAIDPGGVAKGLAADLAAALLPETVRYAISCSGDLAVGGTRRDDPWEVAVTGAFSGAEEHRLTVRAGGIATSGIYARLWTRPDGSAAHHLLDPSTGEPAWTGLVAVTAVAASALDAEILAKTALLSGPDAARRLLSRRGGVLQHDDGRVEVVDAMPIVRLPLPRRHEVPA
jgi:FAD:protein FMN transferase